jgi:hypothetical protein
MRGEPLPETSVLTAFQRFEFRDGTLGLDVLGKVRGGDESSAERQKTNDFSHIGTSGRTLINPVSPFSKDNGNLCRQEPRRCNDPIPQTRMKSEPVPGRGLSAIGQFLAAEAIE